MQYRLLDHLSRPYSRKFLRGIYQLTNGDHEFTYGCVPNGEIGISIVLNGKSEMKTDSGWIEQPAVSVYGLVKKVQFHRMSPHYHEINLGFQPHLLQPFLKEQLSSLEQRVATNLNELLHLGEANRLHEELQTCHTDDQFCTKAEEFLERNLLRDPPESRTIAAYDLVIKGNLTRVDQISSMLNLSSTALRNTFRNQIGISPKDLIKIHRIKKALHFKNYTEESLTQLAYELDYYDQAHFVHDFKDSIGLTPRQYFQNDKVTFDFYNYKRISYDSFDTESKL